MFDSGPVLGIDPGVSRCGYGLVERRGATMRARACGVLRTSPADPLPERLAQLATDLDGLLDELQPAALAVERVLFQANARTAMSVGQASGLALVAAARRGLPVVLYSPNEVKLAVTGDGRADKAAVQMMVTRLLGLDEVPRPPDAADALALAVCHHWRARLGAVVDDARSAAGHQRAPGVPEDPGAASPRLLARIDAALAASGAPAQGQASAPTRARRTP